MINKNINVLAAMLKQEALFAGLGANHLCVHRTSQHIYAQVFSPCGSKVLAQASTLDKDLRSELAIWRE